MTSSIGAREALAELTDEDRLAIDRIYKEIHADDPEVVLARHFIRVGIERAALAEPEHRHPTEYDPTLAPAIPDPPEQGEVAAPAGESREALAKLRLELLRQGMPNPIIDPTSATQWMMKAWDALDLPQLAIAALAEPEHQQLSGNSGEVAALIDQALVDWMVTYADTESGQDEQAAAYTRMMDAGGTLAYIAKARAMLARYLADKLADALRKLRKEYFVAGGEMTTTEACKLIDKALREWDAP